MEQFQQAAAVAGYGDILFKVIAPFFFKPTLAAQLPDQKACTAGDIPQLLFVNIFAVKCRIGQLLFQTAAEHGVKCIFADLQIFTVCRIEYVQRIRIQCAVQRSQRRKKIAWDCIKESHKNSSFRSVLPLMYGPLLEL